MSMPLTSSSEHAANATDALRRATEALRDGHSSTDANRIVAEAQVSATLAVAEELRTLREALTERLGDN